MEQAEVSHFNLYTILLNSVILVTFRYCRKGRSTSYLENIFLLNYCVSRSHLQSYLRRGFWQLEFRDRGFESSSRYWCLSSSFCVCSPLEIEALRRVDLPSRVSYWMANWSITSELNMELNMSQGLIRKADVDLKIAFIITLYQLKSRYISYWLRLLALLAA